MMLATLKQVDLWNIFEFSWTKDLPLGTYLQIYLPPLTILFLNNILLFILDLTGNKYLYFVAYLERHYSFSEFEFSIFRKAVIYLGLNMFLIPALALPTTRIFSLKFRILIRCGC